MRKRASHARSFLKLAVTLLFLRKSNTINYAGNTKLILTTNDKVLDLQTDFMGEVVTLFSSYIGYRGRRIARNPKIGNYTNFRCYKRNSKICLLGWENQIGVVYLQNGSLKVSRIEEISPENQFLSVEPVEDSNYFLAMPLSRKFTIFRLDFTENNSKEILQYPIGKRKFSVNLANDIITIPDSSFGCSSVSYIDKVEKFDFSRMEMLGYINGARGLLSYLTRKNDAGKMICADFFDILTIDFNEEKIIKIYKVNFIIQKILNIQNSDFLVSWDSRFVRIFNFEQDENDQLLPIFVYKDREVILGGVWNEFKGILGFFNDFKVTEILTNSDDLCHPNCNGCVAGLSRRHCSKCRRGNYLAGDNYCLNNNKTAPLGGYLNSSEFRDSYKSKIAKVQTTRNKRFHVVMLIIIAITITLCIFIVFIKKIKIRFQLSKEPELELKRKKLKNVVKSLEDLECEKKVNSEIDTAASDCVMSSHNFPLFSPKRTLVNQDKKFRVRVEDVTRTLFKKMPMLDRRGRSDGHFSSFKKPKSKLTLELQLKVNSIKGVESQ